MDILTNTFKQALRDRKPQIGLWAGLASAYTSEIVAGADDAVAAAIGGRLPGGAGRAPGLERLGADQADPRHGRADPACSDDPVRRGSRSGCSCGALPARRHPRGGQRAGAVIALEPYPQLSGTRQRPDVRAGADRNAGRH
ncbi:hypothetical protein G6F22_017703 [Rhizopus arrhizus]|nr:hypothetical protein G6F22_017703 [Rhizopus arrhizus]